MANKTFPYAVIYDGKFYPANTPIKVAEPEKKEQVAKPTNKKAVTNDDKGTSRKA